MGAFKRTYDEILTIVAVDDFRDTVVVYIRNTDLVGVGRKGKIADDPPVMIDNVVSLQDLLVSVVVDICKNHIVPRSVEVVMLPFDFKISIVADERPAVTIGTLAVTFNNDVEIFTLKLLEEYHV